jgi:hypothetical protein
VSVHAGLLRQVSTAHRALVGEKRQSLARRFSVASRTLAEQSAFVPY